jgi:hypothetical protein
MSDMSDSSDDETYEPSANVGISCHLATVVTDNKHFTKSHSNGDNFFFCNRFI